MNDITQHQKIENMCKDGGWHCQTEFWSMFIMSPHTRRAEIEKQGKYKFESRPCEHNHSKVMDYKMIENSYYIQDKLL